MSTFSRRRMLVALAALPAGLWLKAAPSAGRLPTTVRTFLRLDNPAALTVRHKTLFASAQAWNLSLADMRRALEKSGKELDQCSHHYAWVISDGQGAATYVDGVRVD